MQVRYTCITHHSYSGNCLACLTIGDNVGALASFTVAGELSAFCDNEDGIIQAIEHITSSVLHMCMCTWMIS